MSQPTVEELQFRLLGYLSGQATLSEFRDWFDEATWGLAAEADSLLRQTAGEVELRIAELTSGHLTEAELRSQLESLLSLTDFQLPVTYIEPNAEAIFS